MRVIALPVRSLEESKSRLEPALGPLERAALTLAMLEDVMDATAALSGWETWVVSPDEAVIEIALRRGVRVVVEDEPPLSRALRQVEDEASAAGVDVLAVLLPDTPLVTADALRGALQTIGPVVVAPSLDGFGTNLLVRRPVSAIPSRFGPESCRRHLEAAAEAGLPVAVVERAELAFDVDVPGDILRVLEAAKPGRTLQVCRDLGAAARIPTRT